MAAEAAPAFLWLPELPAPGSELELPADASHYVSRVCRARPGERLLATDGRGAVAELVVRSARPPVAAQVVACTRHERTREAVIACGPPEGERADWLVEKLAEMGAGAFQPIDCERARWRPTAARLERWRRLARAALRQSRQAWEMAIQEPVPVAELASLHAGVKWIADPGGGRWDGTGDRVVIAVGPAGGLTGSEKGLLLEAGFAPLALGPGRLRTETAALCAAALWRAG